MSSSRPHRCDEFPAEYSLASCSPAEPASASSAAAMLQQQPPFVELIPANGNRGVSALSQSRGSPHYYADSGSFYPDSVTDALSRRQSTARALWGERLVSAWQRTHRRDFSTTPSVAFAPSVSARNDRFVIHESDILMPLVIG